MDVTRSNFRDILPVISEAIESSSFISIDVEFSGLTSKKRENAMDTCNERYQKLVSGIKDFMIMQFGICTFSWDSENQQYTAKPFNFYIFPKPYNRQMPDSRFLCQSSSLNFLAEQGFDFNKWISEGIAFLVPADENKLRRMVSAHGDQETPNGGTSTPKAEQEPMAIPPAFEKTIKLIMEKVEKFVNDPEKKSFNLPPSTPLVRKLVYSSVNSAYETGLYLESKTNEENEKFIMITKCTEEEKKDLESKKFDQENVEIEQAVGFSKVVRLLSQSGKVILGHNMLLDLLHTIRLFVSPLPNNLDGFKALIKGVLPRLVDTKVMASTAPLAEHFTLSHLQEVYRKSSEAPFVKPNIQFAEGFDKYTDGKKAHEAGFDAYMTGVAFIAMASFLEKQRDGNITCGEVDFEVIKPFLNKLFLFPRMEDIPYLNLDGNDLTPSRNHVFHIEHPDSWQFSNIQKLFKDFGYVYITKIDGRSAFVSLAKRERASRVLKKLGRGDVPYRIQTYNDFHGIDVDDDKDGGYCVDGGNGYISYQETGANVSFLNESSSSTPSSSSTQSFYTPNKTQETVSSNKSKEDAFASEMEEGELPGSPEPVKKKLKGEHTFFEEPDDW